MLVTKIWRLLISPLVRLRKFTTVATKASGCKLRAVSLFLQIYFSKGSALDGLQKKERLLVV